MSKQKTSRAGLLKIRCVKQSLTILLTQIINIGPHTYIQQYIAEYFSSINLHKYYDRVTKANITKIWAVCLDKDAATILEG